MAHSTQPPSVPAAASAAAHLADETPALGLAGRIDRLLTQSIGLGIEPERMLHDPLYARDVLLVCDALGDAEGPELALALRTVLGTATGTPGTAAAMARRRVVSRPERRRSGRRDRRGAQGNLSKAPDGRERRVASRRRIGSAANAQPDGPTPLPTANADAPERASQGSEPVQHPAADPAPSMLRRWLSRRNSSGR